MTALNLPSPPPDANHHPHDGPIALPLCSLPAAAAAAAAATNTTTPPTNTTAPSSALKSRPILDDTPSTMGESTTMPRQLANTSDSTMTSRRPSTPRSQTDPQPDTIASLSTHQPSTLSYARSHLRSRSGSAIPMARAHSLPTVMQPASNFVLSSSPVQLARPTSPLPSPKRTRSPRALDSRPLTTRPVSMGSFDGAPSVCDISEDAELELKPRVGTTVSSLYSNTPSLSRRRRPVSPLYHVSIPFGHPPTSNPFASTPTSTASSPLFAPAKFNENYPASLASSSVPSTPTSMRSRSPSISSLETIEDSPDAEEEAIEADRIAKLKAAADREDGGDARRSSLDGPEGRGRSSMGFGKRDSRKRWSVCGAERRGDLDLETIWED
ncbi:hypothetical protein COCSADRAFT_40053 [Bipolaris sorokiniana ND90Pr]|uniref:Basic proline-rich protein n=1 Tax=Cochliobolus sativus (strain ND90Pr / ATCC 201652) TaxID=665912 RepID=M2SD44_COCSN|nr:uncharacterized protein COCSADRAFT_40053 [Bipolaris sorokiniana ND90Pr]EMD60410.1 hypothetical protein COCSADRAFT_40053 [Bipolaris sorokiniana ND90Pr]